MQFYSILQIQRQTKRESKNIDYQWHVYVNILEPVVFPLISLARYIIAHPLFLTDQRNLFKGTSQYKCFKKIFNEVVVTHQSELECRDISVAYFGTHYIRKGAPTFVATGCTVFPPKASVCLRKNWTLGGVKDRYIKYKKLGDLVVGRAATGLPILKKEFTMSPPYFDILSCQNDYDKERKKFELNNWVRKIIPT